MPISEFPQPIIEQLSYYVYFLIDPETNQVFYVGKGTGNRIFAHINDALSQPTENDKLHKIREIEAKGMQVKHEILRHGLLEQEAIEIEAALIDFIGLTDLTNQVTGYDTTARGRMSVGEIIALYQAQPIEILEPAILIIINRLFERNIAPDRLYEVTRGNWVVGARKSKARYAFSVYKGIVREVYKIQRWFPVQARSDTAKRQNRWRFDGEVAQELQHYVGGSVEKYLRIRAQNPIKSILIVQRFHTVLSSNSYLLSKLSKTGSNL